MTSWTDKTGRTLHVIPAGGDNPARLVIEVPGKALHPVAFRLDGNADLAEIAVAMFAANGQPAPVITPRPNIDTSHPTPYEGITLSAEPDRVVRIAMDGGCVFRELEPHAARVLAGALVTYADAVESEPDPADVKRLAEALAATGMAAAWAAQYEDVARHLLRSGKVILTGEDGDRG